ncbi:hypothetical protein C2W62_36450 [Candidatus Entotheonella serta]|nr:hypothetical protein C2W62_36450 [Candidatus Entotheonella serta]
MLPLETEEVAAEKKKLLGIHKVLEDVQNKTPARPTGPSQVQEKVAGQSEYLQYKDLALLILLCFLSGFSEKLVPDILARTEQRMRAQEGAGLPAPPPGA